MYKGQILGSIPVYFILLISVKDTPMELIADDTCLVFQSNNVTDIEKQLNEDFAIYEWIADSKLSI